MKHLIIALILTSSSISAHATTVFAGKNQYAGRCAALNLQTGNSSTARLAMSVATNKGEMQIAAQEWMARLSRDQKGAMRSGVLACNLIGIKV